MFKKIRKFTEGEYLKLRAAEKLLAEVQCPMKEEWHALYRVRCDLGKEVFNRRPDDWARIDVGMKTKIEVTV